jgi:hypothetical protein
MTTVMRHGNFLGSLVQVHGGFLPRRRLGNHISAVTVALGLLNVSIRCVFVDKYTAENFFEIGNLYCHKFMANLLPLRSQDRFNSLSNVTRH